VSKYGVLLIGGNRTHQEGYAETFAAHPLCHLVAVSDDKDISEYRRGLNRALAEQWDLPYIDDLDAALSRDDVHIVSMCAEVERRPSVAVRCAEAGKHIYLDKPLCGSVEGADDIAEAVERSGVVTQMYTSVNDGWAQEAKRTVESGRLGELKAVHVEELFSKGPAGSVPEGTVRKESDPPERFTFVESKREMFDVGVYAISLAHWLAGSTSSSVYGMTANYFFEQHARNDIEDFGALSMTLENGVTSTIVAGRFGWMSHPASGPIKLVLTGSDGTATIDTHRPRIEVYSNEPSLSEEPPVHPKDPMGMWASTFVETSVLPKRRWATLPSGRGKADIDAFVDALDEGRRPDITAKEAAAVTEALMGGYASAARGELVELPLPRRKK
jgi:predicted dehydrogenase